MKERAAELRAEGKQGAKKADGLESAHQDLGDGANRSRARGASARDSHRERSTACRPRTWYGMPAYANTEGKVVVFSQDAGKFKYRYSTLGFQEAATLDDEGGPSRTRYGNWTTTNRGCRAREGGDDLPELLDIDGLRLHYEEHGAGVPVVALHGAAVDHGDIVAIEEVIPKSGYRRIYPDLPGMGRSTSKGLTGNADVVQVLIDFIEHIVGEPVMLVGHSCGYLARGVAARRPDLVLGLALMPHRAADARCASARGGAAGRRRAGRTEP